MGLFGFGVDVFIGFWGVFDCGDFGFILGGGVGFGLVIIGVFVGFKIIFGVFLLGSDVLIFIIV